VGPERFSDVTIFESVAYYGSMTTPLILRLGARGSLLSRAQSMLIARALEAAHPGLKVELVIVSTSGDQIQDRPLHEFGGKGLFTKELELALLRWEIDFAVHSYKDVPVTMPLVDVADLVIAAVPAREDAQDLLASEKARTIASLPQRARVGTSSLRRQAQILALRPDLQMLSIRGNIDTRLRKLKASEYDAIILAMAGVKRANLFDAASMTAIDFAEVLPAAAQGALALQCRKEDRAVRDLLGKLNHPPTAQAVELEREVVRLLEGDCHSPIAAYAEVASQRAILTAAVAGAGGQPPVLRAGAAVEASRARGAPAVVVAELARQGAMKLLHGS
jgi:hydroxymethylbilane synthase